MRFLLRLRRPVRCLADLPAFVLGPELTDSESPAAFSLSSKGCDHVMVHSHQYVWDRYCGARVCACGDHDGLARCYCGWARDGGDGRAQLEDDGETIDEAFFDE